MDSLVVVLVDAATPVVGRVAAVMCLDVIAQEPVAESALRLDHRPAELAAGSAVRRPVVPAEESGFASVEMFVADQDLPSEKRAHKASLQGGCHQQEEDRLPPCPPEVHLSKLSLAKAIRSCSCSFVSLLSRHASGLQGPLAADLQLMRMEH